MLHSQNFHNVRIWPRGVDLSQFGPSKRSSRLRASWGVGDAPRSKTSMVKYPVDVGMHWQGRKASLPMTPPMTPEVYAQGDHTSDTVDEPEAIGSDFIERVVLLYVGRMYVTIAYFHQICRANHRLDHGKRISISFSARTRISPRDRNWSLSAMVRLEQNSSRYAGKKDTMRYSWVIASGMNLQNVSLLPTSLPFRASQR